jgi:PKD repeat protein
MRQRVFAGALLAMVLAACGGDGRITEPASPSKVRVLSAIGTDPVTGALIETNLDDYQPGGTISLVGRGWAPNETVHIVMTEAPDTHPDVSRDVQADATGAFSVEFYVVQESDLGATFTLTATGATSGSRATATFTDGNFSMRAAFAPSGGPSFTGTLLKFPQSIVCDPASSGQSTTTGAVTTSAGPSAGVNDDQSARLTVPPSVPGYAFTNWTVAGAVTLQAGSVLTNPSICVRGTETGGAGARTFTANYVAVATNTAPVVSAGADATINEGATFSQNGSFTDPDANSWTAKVNYGDGSGDQSLSITLPAKTFSLSHVYADNGVYTVTVTVNDGTVDGSDGVQVTVNNVPPTATFNAPTSVSGGSPIVISLTSPSDASTVDVTAGFTYAFDCGDGAGYNAFSATTTRSCPTSGTGSRTVKGKIKDKDNGETEYSASVAINNVAPTATAGGPYLGDEGSAIDISGTGSDPDGGTVTYLWSVAPNDGVCTFGDATLLSTTVTCKDNGSWNLTLTVTDDETVSTPSAPASLTVANVKPTATFNAPSSVNEGSPINLSLTSPVEPSTVDQATLQYSFDCGTGAGYVVAAGSSVACPTTDNGSRTVKGKIADKDGGFTEYTASVTINNVAPTATFNAPSSVAEGSPIALSLTGAFDPSSADVVAGLEYAFDCGDGAGYNAFSATTMRSCVTSDNGSRTVKGKIKDKDNGVTEYTASVTITNVAPTVLAGADASITEGDTFSQNGSFTDPGADTWTATVNYGDGTVVQTLALSGKNFALNHTYADNGLYTVTVTVTDDDSGVGSDMVTVTVNNVPPTITSLTVPVVPIAAGTNNVTVSWKFDDPGADTWACQISWDTGMPLEPSLPTFAANPTKTCSATKTLGAGIYTVTVKVTDDDGGSDSETATTYIVVYDPSAGFVTGGGWINSIPGAYVADPELTGKANFGFVSKYKKGQTLPDGNTEFQFHAGNLNFKSDAYEWLVVSGPKAQFKGTGTINGQGKYGFILTATDGQVSGGGGVDKFRMKIWIVNADNTEGPVVYDNQMGAVVDANPATSLGGGSINIQAK